MKTFDEVWAESTCQKRVVVCEILDNCGRVLARESNRCEPTGGVCHRLGMMSVKSDYPSESECNWVHAEARAIMALSATDLGEAVAAVVYGHEFVCPDCEQMLDSIGITDVRRGGFWNGWV